MPAMSSSTVLASRAVALWSIRAVALWMTAWGLFQVGARLTYAVSLSLQQPGTTVLNAMTVYQDIGSTHGFFRGLPLLALGTLIAILSTRLADWIVRPPSTGCVRCGHPIPASEGNEDPRCPECGHPDR